MINTTVPIRPQVLMVTHRFVCPPDRGDRIRTWHTLLELSRHCDVSLACLADEPIHSSHWEAVYNRVARLAIEPAPRGGAVLGLARALASGASATEHTFYSPQLHNTIRQWANERPFDAALAVCSSTVRYLDGVAADRRVVDLIDVDSRKWNDYARHTRGPRRWVYQREARKLAELERTLEADRLFVTSDREADIFRGMRPVTPIQTLGNGVMPVADSEPAGDCPPDVVFTGMLDYRPNVAGLQWFVREVWPDVHQACPSARFRIVGRRPTRAVRELAGHAGVDLVGPVPDVTPYLRKARAAVAPLHIARGVQNKALQAMAAARPVLVTQAVHDGLAVRGRCPAIVPDSPRNWVDTLAELLTHRELASSFGTTGRLFVERHYAWSKTLQPLVRALMPTDISVDTHVTIPDQQLRVAA